MLRCLELLPGTVGWFTNLRYGRGLNPRSKSPPHPRSKERKDRLSQRVAEHLGVIRHLLVEFQEAQCFFMIAIQAAALISLTKSEAFNDAPSILQYFQNISLLKQSASGGIVPIAGGLLLLWWIGLNSWYVFGWSVVTISLSTATFGISFRMQHGEVPKEIAYPDQTTGLEKCGYNQPPLIWCASMSETVFLNFANIYSLAVFGLLLILQFWPLGKSLIQQQLSHRQRQIGWSLPRWMILTMTVVLVLAEIMSLIMTGSYAASMGSLIEGPMKTWNYGQLVSMFIWAPIISKYLAWVFCALSPGPLPPPQGLTFRFFANWPSRHCCLFRDQICISVPTFQYER